MNASVDELECKDVESPVSFTQRIVWYRRSHPRRARNRVVRFGVAAIQFFDERLAADTRELR